MLKTTWRKKVLSKRVTLCGDLDGNVSQPSIFMKQKLALTEQSYKTIQAMLPPIIRNVT